MTTDTKGAYLCAECGSATDAECEWNGVHFCDPVCRSMYVTEAAEREVDWQRDEEVMRGLGRWR